MMDLSRMLRVPILIQHVTQDGPPDGMGDPTEVATWSIHKGYIFQDATSEDTAGGTVERETWRLAIWRSAANQLDSGDRIIEAGQLDADTGQPVPGVGQAFDVAGPPCPVRNPRTTLIEYVIAKLERSA